MSSDSRKFPLSATEQAASSIEKMLSETAASRNLGREVLASRLLQDAIEGTNSAYRNLTQPIGYSAIEAARSMNVLSSDIANFSVISKTMARVGSEQAKLISEFQSSIDGSLAKALTLPDSVSTEIAKTAAAISQSLNVQVLGQTMWTSIEFERVMRELNEPFGLGRSRMNTVAQNLAEINGSWKIEGFERGSIAAAMNLARFADATSAMKAFGVDRLVVVDSKFGSFDTSFAQAESADSDDEAEEVYTSAGRDKSLVAFPSDSFDDVLCATGWAYMVPMPDFIQPDGSTVSRAAFDPHDHYLLNMIEGHLRQLICGALIAAGGEAAMKSLFGQRIPDWIRKQREAVSRGEQPLHLIYYADFMELTEIILNKTLWNGGFSAIFVNRDRFKVTMERLHAFRLQTSHSRPLSKTGRFRLWVESDEIFRALGVGALAN